MSGNTAVIWPGSSMLHRPLGCFHVLIATQIQSIEGDILLIWSTGDLSGKHGHCALTENEDNKIQIPCRSVALRNANKHTP